MLTFRNATDGDIMLYFDWANEEVVRQNSINKVEIIYSEHEEWFTRKMADPDTIMLVFSELKTVVGQLRIEIERENNEGIIDYSIDKHFRGRGFGTMILSESFSYFSGLYKQYALSGFVNMKNIPSIIAFKKAGYMQKNRLVINEEEYIKFSKDG